ncbi:type II toxin-antitoxin system RelE/ParE family toxin [Bradyrhizobium icense]|uniref:type II toxin-antitoxin system RelE/ParE family toxin n=1 Tax=Bradyrhizobium icense TaxID=1274631 RepID=UPI0009F1D215
MARFRLSLLARADLAQILAVSAERWGLEGRRRYAALLTAAMRKAAAQPDGAATRDRAELSRGVRSLHLRYARVGDGETRVSQPVHVLFYRVVRPGHVEIVRVLHERMEPKPALGCGARRMRYRGARPAVIGGNIAVLKWRARRDSNS